MKNIFTLISFLVLTSVFAQNKFEIGYYIDQSGNKIEGEISEIEISNFPESFVYRKGNKTEVVNSDAAKTIKYGTKIFEKREFQFDPSVRFDIANMSTNKNLKLINKTDFLELLVDGNFKLYKYVENGISTFFYEDSSKKLTTLEYKKYLNNGTDIYENKEYLNQLKDNVKNETEQTESYYNTVKYNDTDLVNYFQNVNGKSSKKETKSQLKFNIFVGYSITSMDIDFLQDIGAQSHQHVTIMPEIEYVLNKNLRNPTSFYFNLKYRALKANYEEIYVRENWHHEVDYQSIYIALGVKQYLLSSEKMKFYGKLGIGYDLPIKAEIMSPTESWTLNPIFFDEPSAGINIGVGMNVYKSFLVEIDYDYIFNTSYVNKNTSLNFKVGYSF